MSAARTRRPRDPLSRALTVLGVLVFVFLFLPILVIVVYSFNTGRLLGAWDSFGFDAYTRAWNNPVIGDAVRTSLVAGVLASMVSTVLGTIGGVALARARAGARWAGLLTALLAVTLITPEVIDGIAILPWLVTLGTDGGLAVVNNGMVRLVIVHTSLAVAVVTFIVRARMRGMDEQIEEAAADLYAAPWNRFRQITLPLASPGIFAGALMAFTLSLDNTIVASFVQVPGYTPWPVYVFGSLKVGLRPEIAAVSTVMLLLTLAALAVVWAVLRRSGDDNASVASTFTGG
ncbi:ABC transporter permease [Mumia zhuanghuii]|uniref:ABC transporter permease n=1 Tax=Mumia zhuanghuii TaxID=2585211 RepID=A0A5C4MMQ6_9ACTN|nr:ABC transporter permease [Mumia zhuanghuii]TNC47080.1 ABC transporter permease [Mumia zhuanghuii]TNC50364.1 ABC transporter permease [Mumia zhuanghuii]